MFQDMDWKIMEQKLISLALFPALCKFRLGLRPKDVGSLMNDHLIRSLHSALGKLMPVVNTLMKPTIEVFNGMCRFTHLYSE